MATRRAPPDHHAAAPPANGPAPTADSPANGPATLGVADRHGTAPPVRAHTKPRRPKPPLDLSGVRIVVPMKPLPEAKTRLADALPPERRAALVLAMLARVLEAARAAAEPADRVVIGGDEAVRAAAAAAGARWEPDSVGDLNGTLDAALAQARADGCTALLYLPGDLPRLVPTDVTMLLEALRRREIALAPGDRGGTNAILVPTELAFRFQLGGTSFKAHLTQCLRQRLPRRFPVTVGLANDLDEPADVERLLTDGQIKPLSPRRTVTTVDE